MRLLVCPLVVAALSVVSLGKTSAKRAPERFEEQVVVGELVATTESMPHCGVLATAIKARFRVVAKTFGDFEGAELDVTIGCPEMLGFQIEDSHLYVLRLQKREPRPKTGWSIRGELPKPPRPHFWPRSIQKF